MLPVFDLPAIVRVGGELSALDCRPLPPYAPLVLDFFAALSQRLLTAPQAREYPDVAAFGYWCRRGNLTRLAQRFSDERYRLGRGLAFHIAPANAPVNFAFSLAFGMLSGNANIVRVSDTWHAQTEVVCDALKQLLNTPEYARLAAMNCVISYLRSDEITRRLSALCHVRVLWGGDETIAQLRQMPISPRCVEVAFADRYSLCVLGAAAVSDAAPAALARLAKGFFNDTYLLDQNACSSPHLVIWVGSDEEVVRAMALFWDALADVVSKRYSLSAVQVVDKYAQLCRIAIEGSGTEQCQRHANLIYRIRLGELPADIECRRGRYGLFFEYSTTDLDCLSVIVSEKYQTLTCFGIDRRQLVESIISHGLFGIDRVVPVGRALDIGVIWDGYDLIGTMSRIVDVG